ncbi:MAG TPA: hypothetical protein DD658_06675 [Deltaproteobacteria bacterium]|nr:hypothetical protein [Deltaproteobacteria bacterium]
MENGGVRSGRKHRARKAQFEFPAPEARAVDIVGNFKHWDTKTNPMEKDGKGIWRNMMPNILKEVGS